MLLLTGVGLGCLAVIFIIVARDFGHILVAKVFLALLVSASAFLLNRVTPPEWKWITSDIMTMLPAIFWLLCQLAFARRPRLLSIWSALALYSFITPALFRSLKDNNELFGLVYFFAWELPTYAEYVIILHGMWAVIANWSDDLIASRRKLRGALLGIVGTSSLWVTLSLNTSYGSALSSPVVVTIAALIVASLLLRGRTGVLLGTLSPPTPSISTHIIEVDSSSEPVHLNNITEEATKTNTLKVAQEEDPILDTEKKEIAFNEHAQTLHNLMAEGFYRTEKLTLKKLSVAINLPEYKTRALINQTLAYRNFNDYINQLRIAEAGQRLIEEPDTPILNIALDVGYRTLSSFNRAFKEIFDQSPTTYRQTHNPDTASH